MTCLHPPVSLQDAEAVLVCVGGQDWRSAALLGLAAVVVFAVFVAIGFLMVRAVR